MNSELELFESKKTMTTKELAESLGVDKSTITRTLENMPELVAQLQQVKINGKEGYIFTQAQATAIKVALQNKSHIAKNGYNTLTITNDFEMLVLQQRLTEYQSRRIAELQAENERQKQQITEQKPKVEGYNRIADSSGLKTIKEVADILGYGEKEYFALLRGYGILFKDNGTNLPKREYINSGYFVVKEQPYERNGQSYLYTRIYVTAKGMMWLEKKTPDKKKVSA